MHVSHLTRLVARLCCCLVLALAAGTLAAPVRALAQKSGAAAPEKPIKPVEPVRAILDALTSHDIVALDEGRHGNEQAHALRLELIRHPTFARTVNDIVVEFGSARYQDVMDRYIRGEDVPRASFVTPGRTRRSMRCGTCRFRGILSRRSPGQPTLAKNRRLRVLLADPPIDWTAVKSAPDHFKWLACVTRTAAD